MQEVLINHLFKLAKDNVCLGELTIAVDLDTKQQNKQTKPEASKYFGRQQKQTTFVVSGAKGDINRLFAFCKRRQL